MYWYIQVWCLSFSLIIISDLGVFRWRFIVYDRVQTSHIFPGCFSIIIDLNFFYFKYSKSLTSDIDLSFFGCFVASLRSCFSMKYPDSFPLASLAIRWSASRFFLGFQWEFFIIFEVINNSLFCCHSVCFRQIGD